MPFPTTSTGSLRKRGPSRPDLPMPRNARRPPAAAAALVIAAASVAALAQDPQLLEPERAFAFSARGLDPQTVEARFSVASGYYLYRDKLKFKVEPDAIAGQPV